MKCPACHSVKTDLYDGHRIRTAVDSYYIKACAACGTRFAEPRTPAPGDWYAAAEEWYGWRWEFDQCLEVLPYIVPRGSTILEIGCGEGAVLERAGDSGWFRVVGNEINPNAVQKARGKGIEVVEGSISDVCRAIPAGSMHAVLLFHVLEHVPDPRDFMRQLVTLLAPTGWLFVSVPNPDRASAKVLRQAWDDPPHHLTRFSEAGFRAVLTQAGLDVRSLKREPLDTTPYKLASLRADEITGPLPATRSRYLKKCLPFVASLPAAMLACHAGGGTAMYAAALKA